MMLLDKKSYDLLSYLIKLDKPETVMAIAAHLGQSRRKVYYHLEKINQALPETVEQIVSLPRVGICLNDRQKQACQYLLQDVNDYNYVMKCDERIKLSAIYIAVSTHRVTIDRLMAINDVSRNTVLNDLSDLRLQLEKQDFPIRLQATKTDGYYFDCYPLAFIQFLYKLLDTIYHGGNASFIEFFDHKISQTLGETTYFSKAFMQFLNTYLPIAQINLGKRINRQDSQFMIQILPFILLSYRNMRFTKEVKDSLKEDFNLIWKRKEYYIAKDLAKQIYQHFKLHLDDIEVGLVAMLMLSFRKDKDNHIESPDYDDMRMTLKHFIKALEDRFQLHFTHKSDLIKQLTRHCKALVYRKTYGMSSHNPLTNQIKTKYEDLFEKTRACSPILEEAWSMTLSDDDIAYLTIHLGGDLLNSVSEVAKTKTVIVSDEGIALQKLLHRQCSHYLVNSEIEAVLTTEQFQSIHDLLTVDFVITTNDHLQTSFTKLLVEPILNDDNILSLVRFSKRQDLSDYSSFTDSLEKCIASYIEDEKNQYSLKTQIEALIRQEFIQDMTRK
ncbi:transcription antiterminator [Streptococcus uberis]|uniref:BglG family transcription antiterminator n=1 Tax=Streptococcus uberis TaxID=1349 RepID=UPI0006202D88|nr:transcription antiterminator [Streptococcus uberis]KKF40413.1 L-ascorbate 6-phosphate lactonase [Streptococcus uberis Ab71]KKF59420.1 L-ascorbate 6-phosphate lactonase [Streptococcus uberis C6344]MCK1159780.1 transcription antiterminator [Streptococcus uberis]MCK1161560.1 transcription antiterminator [Streptococcus uberis]MCK1165310.1 transcription antiterminator [Streptococcus uberis]